MTRAADGDQTAWEALVAELGGVVWSVAHAHRLGPADAADVVQTTWLRLVECVHDIHTPALVGAWLATTARRECLALIRRQSQVLTSTSDLPELPSDEPHPGERVLIDQRTDAVGAALEQLIPRDQALLRMLVADPTPSYDEIGATLGMPIGSIGPTRARALARWRHVAVHAGLPEFAAELG